MITSVGPTHSALSVTRAAGRLPMRILVEHVGRIGPPTWGTGGVPGVTIGQVCMSVTRAAGLPVMMPSVFQWHGAGKASPGGGEAWLSRRSFLARPWIAFGMRPLVVFGTVGALPRNLAAARGSAAAIDADQKSLDLDTRRVDLDEVAADLEADRGAGLDDDRHSRLDVVAHAGLLMRLAASGYPDIAARGHVHVRPDLGDLVGADHGVVVATDGVHL